MQRVERGHRLLKHHGDAVAAQALHVGFAGLCEVAALEADDAGDFRAFGQQPHQRERGHCLAGPGLADDAERLSFIERKRDVTDDALQAAGRWQINSEVLRVEQHLKRPL